MRRGTIIGIIIVVFVLILILAVLALIYGSNSESASTGNNIQVMKEESLQEEQMENVVEIISSGFKPSSLTISQGESVSFINKDSNKHWPASDVHPTHIIYPGSDIDKCGTAEEEGIFDACHGLSQGEIYSFVFQEKGTWGFHDHLRANLKGRIIVN